MELDNEIQVNENERVILLDAFKMAKQDTFWTTLVWLIPSGVFIFLYWVLDLHSHTRNGSEITVKDLLIAGFVFVILISINGYISLSDYRNDILAMEKMKTGLIICEKKIEAEKRFYFKFQIKKDVEQWLEVDKTLFEKHEVEDFIEVYFAPFSKVLLSVVNRNLL